MASQKLKDSALKATEVLTEPFADDETETSSHIDDDSAGSVTAKVLGRKRPQKSQPWKAYYAPSSKEAMSTGSLHDMPWYNNDTTPEAYDSNSGS